MKTFKDYIVEEYDYSELQSKIYDNLKKNGYNKNMVEIELKQTPSDLFITAIIKKINVKMEDIEKIMNLYKYTIQGVGNLFIKVTYDDNIKNQAKTNREYKEIEKYLSDKNNVNQWLHPKKSIDFEIMYPKSAKDSHITFYNYKWKGKTYTPRDKDYISPLWYLLYRVGIL